MSLQSDADRLVLGKDKMMTVLHDRGDKTFEEVCEQSTRISTVQKSFQAQQLKSICQRVPASVANLLEVTCD